MGSSDQRFDLSSLSAALPTATNDELDHRNWSPAAKKMVERTGTVTVCVFSRDPVTGRATRRDVVVCVRKDGKRTVGG